MASVFSRHETNRARLGRSRKTSCWPPTTPQTLQELERALLEEWERIPQLVINSLIDSMPQRQGYLRMSQQRDLLESMACRVIGRLESGQTQRSVADAVGVARSVVARMWNRFQETGNVRRRPGGRQLLLATGRRVSSQTVRNRLHEEGLYARRPMVCIPSNPRHRAARRRWAAEHREWEQHD
ncbi:HTH_Tnp_Tc3_2 domain-containing protein [Trichonephila clavipes]|nr:HTH_Tnp_Tc3_2 domain-containing protein [Trichonephila clavipes]